MHRTSILVSALLLLTTACQTPGYETRVGVRAAGVIVESYDAEVSSGTLVASGDTDYESIEGGIVLAKFDATGVKRSTGELLLGSASYGNIDAFEIAGGGRWFISETQAARPWFSIHAVSTSFDDVGGIDIGDQLGLRAGLGLEFPLGCSGAYFDVGGDYTLALIEAEDTTGLVETEVEGLALRIGLGWDF